MKKIIVAGLISVLLSGCMNMYNSSFKCPPDEGYACESLLLINDRANAGEFSIEQRMTCKKCGKKHVRTSR